MEFDAPKARLVVWKSSFHNEKSSHESTIMNHPFNHKVEVLVPASGSHSAMPFLEQVGELWMSKGEGPFFHVTCPLSALASPAFVRPLVEQGNLVALSYNAKIDCGAVFAISPQGVLYMFLDKDMYEQLGLVGKPSALAPKGEGFVVSINLLTMTDNVAKRLNWCLEARVEPVECVVALSVNGENQAIDFPAEFSATLFENSMAVEAIHAAIPDFRQAVVDDADDPTIAVFNWLGGVSNRMGGSLEVLEPIVADNEEITSFTCRGLVSSQFILDALDVVRSSMPSSLPWAAVHVWGFPDAPVSWETAKGGREHFFVESGENDFCFIVFPDGEYWSIQTLANDMTT